jgi:uncharacterized protein (DUF433 family)
MFVKGTRIMARILYGMVVSEEEPRTPEEIAHAFGLPLAAVHEAIAYCESDPPEIREDWEREEANVRARAVKNPTAYPAKSDQHGAADPDSSETVPR